MKPLFDYIYQHEIRNINTDKKMFLNKFENDTTVATSSLHLKCTVTDFHNSEDPQHFLRIIR